MFQRLVCVKVNKGEFRNRDQSNLQLRYTSECIYAIPHRATTITSIVTVVLTSMRRIYVTVITVKLCIERSYNDFYTFNVISTSTRGFYVSQFESAMSTDATRTPELNV